MNAQTIKISLKHQSKYEAYTQKQLIWSLEEYDLSPWFFTDTLIIADGEIPHSHPVLTLNTRRQSDLSLLSTFIHEQVHWFLDQDEVKTNKAIEVLKEKFPEVPVGNGQGAKSEYSTYLHLLVNYFEYDGIKALAGERAAQAICAHKKYYRWIYKTVLEELDYLGALIEENDLEISGY